MQRLGNELLAGAALALYQDGGPTGRDLSDELEEPQHGVALADDVLKVVTLLEGALELHDLCFSPAASDGGADVGEQLLVVPGFLHEVLGAGVDRFDDITGRSRRQ